MSNGRAPITDQQIADAKLVLESASRESRLDKDEFQRAVNSVGFKPSLIDLLKKLAKPRPKSDLLETLKNMIKFPAIEKFRAIDHFKITPNEDRKTAEVVIGWISDNFRNLFLQGEGKIEENIPAGKLQLNKLKRASVDGPIIAELGGETLVETTLAEMFYAMKLQGRGQKGALLTNGYANIFYVRDTEGNLWAVYGDWRSGYECWHVSAYSITDPARGDADDQVLVRDSSGSENL
ncbi:hypothetical protein ACFL14_03205 [Patescibacteria group bacterium]